jgi:hypothetical protein
MEKYIKVILSLFLSVTVVLAQGCSAFQPKQQSVTITASRPGASIYVNNNPVGTSPVSLMLDRNKTYAVSATYAGKTGTSAIGRKVSGTGVLDIVGGVLFLVPW